MHGSIERRETLTAPEARALAQELTLEKTSWADLPVPRALAEEPAPGWTGMPPAGDPRREVDRLRARLEAVYAELGLERRRSEEPSEQVDRLTRALHQMEMDHLCVEAAASRRLADILSNAATPVQIEPERKDEQKSVH